MTRSRSGVGRPALCVSGHARVMRRPAWRFSARAISSVADAQHLGRLLGGTFSRGPSARLILGQTLQGISLRLASISRMDCSQMRGTSQPASGVAIEVDSAICCLCRMRYVPRSSICSRQRIGRWRAATIMSCYVHSCPATCPAASGLHSNWSCCHAGSGISCDRVPERASAMTTLHTDTDNPNQGSASPNIATLVATRMRLPVYRLHCPRVPSGSVVRRGVSWLFCTLEVSH